MARELARHVVLIGMMGAGKTAVGTELARRLGVRFVDSDAEIESAATMKIAEIFARDGEPFFRDREAEVIARLLERPPCVLSTGGGAWMQARNRDAIRAHGLSVWLNCDLDTLWHRVRQRSNRPLLKTSDPKGTLARLLAERNPTYATADLDFPAHPGDSVEVATLRLIATLGDVQPPILTDISPT